MNDLLKVFNYQGTNVRTVLKNDEPWFVAKDICEILEIDDNRSAIQRLSDFMKGVDTIRTLGGNQQMTVISESGVYKLVFTSRKPEAEKFTDWLALEVIPSIRKHGGYLTPEKIEEVLLNPDTVIKLATSLKDERQKRLQLEAKVNEDKPKVAFADAVTTSKSSVLVGELAKILKQNGIEIGQNRLFQWLRDEGYLCKSGENYNLPTQYAMELELFEIKKTTVNNPDGSSRITRTTKVTGKGQVYFVHKFLDEKIEKSA